MFGIVDMLVVVITLDWYIETITNIKRVAIWPKEYKSYGFLFFRHVQRWLSTV
jgi:hypothetical protein